MTLKSAIKSKKVSEIRKITKETPTADIADMLEELSSKERVLFFRLLKTNAQSDIFASLEKEYQEQLVEAFSNEEIIEIFNDLYADDIADLIEAVSEEIAKKIMNSVSKKHRDNIKKILRYDDDTTGSIMNVNMLILKQSMTISQSVDFIKKSKNDFYISHYQFVIDNKNKLVGFVTTEDLLFAKSTKKVKELIKPTGFVYTTTKKEDAAQEFANYDMSVLPVLNAKKELVGVITSDEILDVVKEEADDDIAKITGIKSEAFSTYSKGSTFKIYKARIFWLLLLLIPATLSHFVIIYFEDLGNKMLTEGIITVVVATIPLIMDSAGNAGSQTAATVIRSLAVGDITTKDYLKVFRKELKVSILAGLTLGVFNFVRMLIMFGIQKNLGTDYIVLAIGLSLSLFIIIVFAKLLGGLLPLLAKAMGGDPAVMASPMLTTIIDTLALVILFGISIGIVMLI